mmetsp:Transcript_20538/g.58925  ORF Transcript_20538/g.58925 Transcript_20538/m.58925 type:complete len:238 (-) Transcript_20538:494-1207(-)
MVHDKALNHVPFRLVSCLLIKHGCCTLGSNLKRRNILRRYLESQRSTGYVFSNIFNPQVTAKCFLKFSFLLCFLAHKQNKKVILNEWRVNQIGPVASKFVLEHRGRQQLHWASWILHIRSRKSCGSNVTATSFLIVRNHRHDMTSSSFHYRPIFVLDHHPRWPIRSAIDQQNVAPIESGNQLLLLFSPRTYNDSEKLIPSNRRRDMGHPLLPIEMGRFLQMLLFLLLFTIFMMIRYQ